MKIGASMACIWGVAFACLLGSGWIDEIDLERVPHLLMLVSSLLVICVGIPAFRDPDLRHRAALFYIVLGVVLLGAAAALLALIVITSLLSGWNITSHN